MFKFIHVEIAQGPLVAITEKHLLKDNIEPLKRICGCTFLRYKSVSSYSYGNSAIVFRYEALSYNQARYIHITIHPTPNCFSRIVSDVVPCIFRGFHIYGICNGLPWF